MGVGQAPGSITTIRPTPIVILGLDPGICCIGKPVKGLGNHEARRRTTYAALADALRIPGSSPRMTWVKVETLLKKLYPRPQSLMAFSPHGRTRDEDAYELPVRAGLEKGEHGSEP